jgi:hypothetical protein
MPIHKVHTCLSFHCAANSVPTQGVVEQNRTAPYMVQIGAGDCFMYKHNMHGRHSSHHPLMAKTAGAKVSGPLRFTRLCNLRCSEAFLMTYEPIETNAMRCNFHSKKTCYSSVRFQPAMLHSDASNFLTLQIKAFSFCHMPTHSPNVILFIYNI